MTVSLRTILAAAAALLLALPAPAQTEGGGALPQDFSLVPGDLLKVAVWREPDLSGEFPVDQDGTLVLPLLGQRRVAGVPWPVLRDSLMADYQRQLRNPSISIFPLRRVSVFGYVARPGVYTLDPTLTLAGAIAMAGGASPEGDVRRIRIVRGGESMEHGLGGTETLTAADVRSGDQIIVERRSWMDRNSPIMVSALLSVLGIIASVVITSSMNDGGGSSEP
jgi:protein involved in polysaccharide export with SLBB domain